jgi:phenylacetate-CoA ligase
MHGVDIYGLSEVMGPGVANEAVEEKDGLYIWEDHFLPEIIDPDSGAVRADGSEGELVFTSLTKEALPIIRYRTRDLTTLRAGTARSMRRMDKITGRSDDLIILRGVNVFPSQIEEHILKIDGISPHYQIELAKDGPLDSMTVRVEAAPGNEDDDRRAALAALLGENIKQNVGISAAIDVTPVGAVDRSAGKAVRIIDRRDG